MNIELEIISNVVESGDLRKAKTTGITSDFFRTSLAQEAWQWLCLEAEKRETFGEVPDQTRLLRRFPDFSYHPTKNSIESLYREANEMYLDKDTHALVDELQNMLEDDLDARTVIMEGIEKLKILHSSSVVNDGSYMEECASELKARYMKRKENEGITGMRFPYDCLNAMTGGTGDGTLSYIYGRPGMMKSWLLCVFAAYLSAENRRIMLYTKEIDEYTLMERVASIMLGLNYSKFRGGHCSPEEEQRFLKFIDDLIDGQRTDDGYSGGMFFVTDKGCKVPRTVDKLMAIAERIKPDIIFIDGFYLLNPGRSNERKKDHEKIKAISRSLKSYAQSLNTPIICTSQANREGKNNLSVNSSEDAAFSDAVGQDADLLLRVEKGPNPLVHDGNALLIIPKKVREGGGIGTPRAFTINANPSYDWSLLEYPTNPEEFRKRAKEYEENQLSGIPSTTVSGFRKKKKKGTYKP